MRQLSRRLLNRATFEVERLIVRGTWYRLLVIAVAIFLIAAGAGLFVFLTVDGFSDLGASVWWAFLRLTDPGYLGDDDGALLRSVSTVVTVSGYVLFMGSLIAIMTQWLNETIRRLQSGLTPIAKNNHILVLGWTNRTPTIVKELVLSEGRVTRFLQIRGARKLHVVLLVEEVTPALVAELRDELGDEWSPTEITLRSGSPLRIDHLERVDYLNASAILLPGDDRADDFQGADTDARAIKVLLSATASVSQERRARMPFMVAEIAEPGRIGTARRAYGGPVEIVASDRLMGRLIAQTVRHRGLSTVVTELLSQGEGNEIYVRRLPELDGARFSELNGRFPSAIPIGFVLQRDGAFVPLLDPAPERVQRDGESLVFIARTYEATAPNEAHDMSRSTPGPTIRDAGRLPRPPIDALRGRKLLVLGWSRRIPSVLAEVGGIGVTGLVVDVMSRVPIKERDGDCRTAGLASKNIEVRQHDGDYTQRADLADLAPSSYSAILFAASELVGTDADADARTLLGNLVLDEARDPDKPRPHVVVELNDDDNEALLEDLGTEVLVRPHMLSHVLSQVALRRELRSVYDELFGPGGAEIVFRPASQYGLAGKAPSFRELQRAAAQRTEVAIGVRVRSADGAQTELNPSRFQQWKLGADDAIIVLTHYEDPNRR